MYVLLLMSDHGAPVVQAATGLFPTMEEARAHGWQLLPGATELDAHGRYCDQAGLACFQVVPYRSVPIAGTIPYLSGACRWDAFRGVFVPD